MSACRLPFTLPAFPLPAFPLLASSLGLIVALPAIGFILTRDFDGLYGQDPYAYYGYATGALREALLGLQLPPPFAWPPGYPLLVAFASLLVGTAPAAGQTISLLSAAIVPPATGLLAYELLPDLAHRRRTAIALLAGLLVALVGQLWQSGVVVMSDTTGLALATTGAWALARYANTAGLRWIMLAGAALALAISVRWAYGLVALPLGLLGLYLIVRGRPSRPISIHLAVPAVAAVLILTPTVLPMAMAALGGGPIPFAVDFAAYHWDLFNALRSQFETVDGTLSYGLPTGAYYLGTLAQWYFFTPLALALVVPGLAYVVRTSTAVRMTMLLAWPAITLGFLIGSSYQNPRFLLPVLPPLAILIALGGAQLSVHLQRRVGRGLAATPLVLVALGAVVMLVGAHRLTSDFIDRQQTDRQAARALAASLPPEARMVSFGPTLSLRYDLRDEGDEVLELWELSPEAALALAAAGQPMYLLVDAEAMENQWAALPVGATFQALRDGPGLHAVARNGIYTLFEVGRSRTGLMMGRQGSGR
jgi:4-amino-4-deoxy-L-arabinose transferase-like glycosyltransferase